MIDLCHGQGWQVAASQPNTGGVGRTITSITFMDGQLRKGFEVMYQEVPVERAKVIADECNKDIVAVLSWDRESGLLHTTTYGKSATDKIYAAGLGDILAKAAGSDISKAHTFEDFRSMPAAEANEMLEAAWGLLANVSNGDWGKQTTEWKDAVQRWRERYHVRLRCLKEISDAATNGGR